MLGTKHNYGLPCDAVPTATNVASFFRALHLPDLALAHACALGRELAWKCFLSLYRRPLTEAAVAITGSGTLGHDLADSLHAQLFGLTERDGQRRSPLESYSGRGSLMGWLRTTFVQRHIDHYRHKRRESPLEAQDPPVPPTAEAASPVVTQKLQIAIVDTLQALSPEDRFLLSSYFLDQYTLRQIAQPLRVHEATVSRKLNRLTVDLRKRMLKSLQISGLSRRGAEEALGTDPRDLTINLRSLLQTPSSRPFPDQTCSLDQIPRANFYLPATIRTRISSAPSLNRACPITSVWRRLLILGSVPIADGSYFLRSGRRKRRPSRPMRSSAQGAG